VPCLAVWAFVNNTIQALPSDWSAEHKQFASPDRDLFKLKACEYQPEEVWRMLACFSDHDVANLHDLEEFEELQVNQSL
jgi:hypothetical protein